MTQVGEPGSATLPRSLSTRKRATQLSALLRCQAPLVLFRRRTVAGVGAYFDLVTDEGRLFFGDSFHLGYFATGQETISEARDALTDLVAGLARIGPGSRVLDLGCGVGEPAVRIARRHECKIIGVNASREQVRQGRLLIQDAGLAARIDLRHGNALALDLPDCSVDSVVCLEAAGDICVTAAAKDKLLREILRVLRPGGHVGFCDLVFTQAPTAREDKALSAVLYHKGSDMVTDWPQRFMSHGFSIAGYRDLHAATLPTWVHILRVSELRSAETKRIYGKAIVNRVLRQEREMMPAIARCGAYPAFTAEKPG
jgi:cyclopropane fatty-acyl-phospholipid synthase-like methyltransferase